MNNKEPFDYNKCIERGGYAITRDGRRVRLLCDNEPTMNVVVAVSENGEVDSWLYTGLLTPPPEPKRITGYLGIYHDGHILPKLYDSPAEARKGAVFGEPLLACVYINVAEGEGITDADYPDPGRIVAVVPDRDSLGGFYTKGKVYPVKGREGRGVVIIDDHGVDRPCALMTYANWQPIHANKTYAVTDYEVLGHITPGKIYEASKAPSGFHFINDRGIDCYSTWSRSMHMDGRDWTRIDGADYA